MLVKLTMEQRNNILGLIARAPKLPNESSFDFARVIGLLEQALMNPIPDKTEETKNPKLDMNTKSQANNAPENGEK